MAGVRGVGRALPDHQPAARRVPAPLLPEPLGFPWGAVTVPGGRLLVVDDVLPPAGRIRFVAADAATGDEVRDFCVQDPLELGFICSGPAGIFPNGYVDLEMPPGRYRFTGNANDGVQKRGWSRRPRSPGG